MRGMAMAATLCASLLVVVQLSAVLADADATEPPLPSWLEKFVLDDDAGALLRHLESDQQLNADDRSLLLAVANGTIEVRSLVALLICLS